MAGGLLALVVRSDTFLPSKFLRAAWLSLFIAAPLAFIAEAFQARWITFTLSAVASAAFVYLSLFANQKWFRVALTNRWLVYTGTISYGLYLLHKIPFDIVQWFHFDRNPLLALPMGLAASYGMATLSWSLLEKPCLRLKRFFEPRPGRLPAGR
jgi:peptidoglycan/LPS O-acetylase OafA/YrhL